MNEIIIITQTKFNNNNSNKSEVVTASVISVVYDADLIVVGILVVQVHLLNGENVGEAVREVDSLGVAHECVVLDMDDDDGVGILVALYHLKFGDEIRGADLEVREKSYAHPPVVEVVQLFSQIHLLRRIGSRAGAPQCPGR